jgi:hypothetical protein
VRRGAEGITRRDYWLELLTQCTREKEGAGEAVKRFIGVIEAAPAHKKLRMQESTQSSCVPAA